MKTANPLGAHRAWQAFSLTELLVVIGILALLVSLLVPTFTRSRERAKKAKCQAVLRQVYLLTRMYADDHDGEMPVRADLFPGGKFPDCPSSPQSGPEIEGDRGYRWIYYYLHRKRQKARIDPQWVLVGDRRPWHDPNRTWEPPPIGRWTGGHNTLYGDGHLAWERVSSPP